MVIQCVRCGKIRTRRGWESAGLRDERKLRRLETLCPQCARAILTSAR